MQSEVRKVLEKLFKNPVGLDAYAMWWHIDTAERADAAGRDESVQALRKEVAELVAKWRTCFLPTPVAEIVRDLLTELNAIIATKPESQPATASGPVHPVIVQQMRDIAAQTVRDAIPDVIDAVAGAVDECGFTVGVNSLRKHADKLRKERGA